MARFLAATLAAALVAAPAHAAFIANGGFETGPTGVGNVNGNLFTSMPSGSGTRSWDVWNDLPGGWTTTAGNGIEIQTAATIGKADPRSGAYYVELDSHPNGGAGSNSTMAQTVGLAPGLYRLSYWYQPRTNRAGDNVLSVFFDGKPIAAHDESGTSQPEWTAFSAIIDVETAGDYEIAFAAGGTANQTGALLDDVELAVVPAPAALPLMLGGLAGIAYWTRRRRG